MNGKALEEVTQKSIRDKVDGKKQRTDFRDMQPRRSAHGSGSIYSVRQNKVAP